LSTGSAIVSTSLSTASVVTSFNVSAVAGNHYHAETASGHACTTGNCVISTGNSTGGPSATNNAVTGVNTTSAAYSFGGSSGTFGTSFSGSVGNNSQTTKFIEPLHTHSIGSAGTTSAVVSLSSSSGTGFANSGATESVGSSGHTHVEYASGSSCPTSGTCVSGDSTSGPSGSVTAYISINSANVLISIGGSTSTYVTSIPSATGNNVTP
jgi:hypothetical protein